jgi:hypothetical protein
MISRSRVSLGEPSEWADSGDKTFVVRLWRSKVSHEQDLSIVPHQSEMLLDWVFAFAYSAVMNTNPNDSLFPTFAEKVELRNLSAGNINDEEIGNETTQDSTLKAKVDSSKKVTKYFQALLERLIKTSEELVGPNEMARAAGLYQDDEDFSEEFDGSSCVGTTSVNNEPGIFNLTGEEETVGLDPPANGFVDFVLETIITTSEVKQDGVIYDVVSNAGKGVIINDFKSSSSKFLTVVELLDEVLEGSWGMPGCFHALFVGAHVAGTNFAKLRPKMSDDDNRRHFVEATSGMTE